MTVKDIYDFFDNWAPFSSQLSFDNAGLNIGSKDSEIHKIGVVLDITESAAEYAVKHGIDLIVSHHPVIFNGLRKISEDDVVYTLIKNGISAIGVHTNLDAASGGVCDTLCSVLNVNITENAYLDEFPNQPIAKMGTVKKTDPNDFAKLLKARLNAPDIRYNAKKPVEKVGIFNGAGSDLLSFAYSHGADTVVTSDIKHHEWLYAAQMGLNLYDAGHFCTENIIVKKVCDMLNDSFDNAAVIIPQTAPYAAI